MHNNQILNNQFLRFLLWGVLIVFVFIIRDYLIALLLAMIFTSLLYPLQEKLEKKLKGKSTLASVLVLTLFLLIIVLPSIIIIQQVVSQAIEIAGKISTLIPNEMKDGVQAGEMENWINSLSKYKIPFSGQLSAKIPEFLEKISNLVAAGLSSLTQGTFTFFLNFFVMLYAMFYFLPNGKQLISKAKRVLPIAPDDFDKIMEQFVSISAATIKGAFLIGLVQGALVGLGFWVVGIPGPIFWGAVAALASLIPSVGTALIYVPVSLYLIMTGSIKSGIGLLIWGGAIVSSVDNFLRPYLVGKDIKMPEILILVSTLGGITFFGISGIVIGPLIAGLFITLAKIYLQTNKA